MPFPYHTIPSVAVWKQDSSARFAIRSNDRILVQIDSLLAAYHDPGLNAVIRDTLFYLRSAIHFWRRKLNKVPGNTAPTGLNSTNLPTTMKFRGETSRANAIDNLLAVVTEELCTLFGVGSEIALNPLLRTAYGADNHGVAADQHWLLGVGHAAVSIFLTDAGAQRQYKLRFRAGIAWRWNPPTTDYQIFDSTDNRESEINDQMVHFVMDEQGRIYSGFDKDAIWFKHSSLVGGADGLAAGRMKVENGVVTAIENDSGHYAPIHKHMRNLLRRLELYGSDLHGTVVIRNSDKHPFTAAEVLASTNAWPDGGLGH